MAAGEKVGILGYIKWGLETPDNAIYDLTPRYCPVFRYYKVMDNILGHAFVLCTISFLGCRTSLEIVATSVRIILRK